MPLTEDDFASIRTLVERQISEIGQAFVTGKVIKRDEKRRLVWLAEVGDQPIPVVDFLETSNYYIPRTTQEAWREIGGSGNPSFASNWGNFGSGFENVAFRFTAAGYVELKGLIQKTGISAPSVNEVMFTLPAGYRPAATKGFKAASGGAGNVHGRVDVGTGGTVHFVQGEFAVNAFMFLDGIMFEPAGAGTDVPIVRRTVPTLISVPQNGATVLVAFERGTRRLPRCLGEIQSLEYVESVLQVAASEEGGGPGGS